MTTTIEEKIEEQDAKVREAMKAIRNWMLQNPENNYVDGRGGKPHIPDAYQLNRLLKIVTHARDEASKLALCKELKYEYDHAARRSYI